MKNKKKLFVMITVAIAVIAVASVSIIIAADARNTVAPNASANGGTVYLAEETVKKLALNHAGVQEADVTGVSVKLDRDDGRVEYEVKFRKDNVKYEYEIDAVTGTILSYDAESKKVLQNKTTAAPATTAPAATEAPAATTPPAATEAPVATQKPVETRPPATQAPAGTTYMTQEEAKDIVLNHANVKAADATFTKVKLDYDDGRAEYEVDFYTNTTKYDYEIDAITGTIRSVDTETKKGSSANTGNAQTGNTAPQEYISQSAAKEIALNHAGLKEADVSRLKIELDYDDGRAEYEIEFQVGRTEYEYEINATTGSIIYFEKDIDD